MAESTTVCEIESKGSEDVFEMYCEPCHRERQRETACAFCSDCVTYFCSTCLQYHRRIFPGHNPLEGEKIHQDLCIEKCQSHIEEILKYFCITCNKFVCCICKTEHHKKTCNMKYLSDFVTDTKVKDEFKCFKAYNDDTAKRLSGVTENIDVKYENISVCATEAKAVIQREKEAIFLLIEDEVSKLEETIQTAKRKDIFSIDKVKEKFELLQIENNKLSENIKTIKQYTKGRKYTLFLKMKQLNRDLSEMNEILDDLTKDSLKTDKQFEDKVSQKSNDLIKRVKEFGQCSAVAIDHFGKDVKKKVCFVEDIVVKDSSDQKACFISDLCILSEQCLVMHDRSNNCLKVINLKSKKLLDLLSLKSAQETITKITDTEIATVGSYEKDERRSIIQFLKLTNAKQLVFKKRYILTEIGMYCTDIAYIDDDKLVIALTANFVGKLQIINMSGRVINTIDKNENGDYIFNCPFRLHVDTMKKHFYVSDFLNDSVHKVDIDTLNRYQYSPPLCFSKGITTDEGGYIYICQHGARCIQVYHTDDTQNSDKQILIQYTKERPQNVLFSVSMSKLYVSFVGTDCVKVYNIISS